MSHSVTFRVPPARRIGRAVAILVVAAVVLLAGVRIGAELLAGDPVQRLSRSGGVQEVVTPNGTFLGRVVQVDRGLIRLADPALIRAAPQPSAGASPGPQILIQVLSGLPYLIGSEIVLPADSVTFVGTVAPGSELERVYLNAISGSAQPSASPSR